MYFFGWVQSTLPVAASIAASALGVAWITTPSLTIIVPIHRLPPDRMLPAVLSAAACGNLVRQRSAPLLKSRQTMSGPSISATARPSVAMFSDGSSLAGVVPPFIAFHRM